MNVNNTVNKMQFTSKNDTMVSTMEKPIKEVINDFYSKVRLELPQEGKYDEISTSFKNPSNKGEYTLSVREFLADKGQNSLRLNYIYNDGKTASGVGLIEGSKQDILDYLGNERNIAEINYYMSDLKKNADIGS